MKAKHNQTKTKLTNHNQIKKKIKNNNFGFNNFKAKNNNDVFIYGKNSVFAALKNKKREIFKIFVSKNSLGELENFLLKNNLKLLQAKIEIVDNEALNMLLGESVSHQGVAIKCSLVAAKSQNDLLVELENIKNQQQNLPILLITDQIQDPHNMGAIIRSACAFGVTRIIFSEHNSVKESAIINKSSAGMVENVDLFMVVNLSNLLEQLKKIGYWCFGLAGEADKTIKEVKFAEYKNIALIIGGEGNGIRPLVKKNCDMLIKIPMVKEVESLNASVAASIALWSLYDNVSNS